MRPKAVGYIRVSGQDQARSGLSLEEQQRDIERAAEEHGLELIAIFKDAGVSGGKPLSERDGLTDAISQLPRGGVLLASKRDRLGRDMYEIALIEHLVRGRKARIVSAAGEGTSEDPDDPSAFLLRGITDLFAHYERLMGKVRMRAAARAKKARGEPAGFCEFGYQKNEEGKLEENPAEQEVIKLVVQWRKEGMTQRAIVDRLEEEGVFSSRSGKPFRLNQVQRILKRWFHIQGME